MIFTMSMIVVVMSAMTVMVVLMPLVIISLMVMFMMLRRFFLFNRSSWLISHHVSQKTDTNSKHETLQRLHKILDQPKK